MLTWQSFVQALVCNHLSSVAPSIAEDFRTMFLFPPSHHCLEDFVAVLRKTFYLDKQQKREKCVLTKGGVLRRGCRTRIKFTPEEDELILTRGDKVSFTSLAKTLGRSRSSVADRYSTLTRGFSSRRTKYSLLFDQEIIDAIVAEMSSSSRRRQLSEVSLSTHKWKELGDKLQKAWSSVRARWARDIFPMIMQHYSGTLNLRVEQMLANHIVDMYGQLTYAQFNDINWSEVAERPEFAGHTRDSLRNRVYHCLLLNGAKKLRVSKEEMTTRRVAQYACAVYGGTERARDRNTGSEKKRLIVDYFLQKVAKVGLSDFI